jgi:ArsR family transcriptional regulator
MNIEIASRQLLVIGNPTRLDLYRVLVRAGRAGLAVGEIQERLGVPASTLSHHIKQLVSVGLVIQDRQGTSLICRASYPQMQALVDFLAGECCLDDPEGDDDAA